VSPALDVVERIVGYARTAAPPHPMRTRAIAIDGCGGAGKSTLAQRVAAALDRAQVVPTDDFARPENPVDWWPEVVECVLEPLHANAPGRYLRYDWLTRSASEWVEVWPADYVLLEGVSASRHAFRPYLSLTVWVETPRDIRLRRGLARDGPEARDQWLAWMAREDAYVTREQPRQQANLIVSGTGPESPRR
jgi:uridine kinase